MDLDNGGAAAGGDGGAAAGAGEGGAASAAEIFGGGAAAGADGAAAGADGAAAGAAGGDQGGGDAGAADPAWFDQVSTDVAEGEKASLRDFLKSSNVKDINGLVTRFRDTQRALHDSGRIKVPGEGATEAEVKAYRAAIGVPDDAKGYETPVPKDAEGKPLLGPDGQPVKLNAPLLDRLKASAHKSGVPKSGFDALVQDFVQMQMEEVALGDSAQIAEADAKRKEWGDKSNAKLAAINSALSALGLNREEALAVRAALGAGRSMDIFAKLGEGIAEDVMLNGRGSGGFGITGAQAQAQVDEMKKDPAVAQKIMVPGTAERARYDRLLTIVAAEEDRKQARGE